MDTNSSKTKLVLIELIIIILFFALASAVCVNIFAQARFLSVSSTDTTNAALAVQTAAETIRSSEDELVRLDELYAKKDTGYYAYYDENWNETDEASAKYNMVIQVDSQGDLLVADIAMNRDSKAIYAITTKKYTGK